MKIVFVFIAFHVGGWWPAAYQSMDACASVERHWRAVRGAPESPCGAMNEDTLKRIHAMVPKFDDRRLTEGVWKVKE